MNVIPVAFQQLFRHILWSLTFNLVKPHEEVAKMGSPAPQGVSRVTLGIEAAQVDERESPRGSLADRYDILDVLRLEPAPIDGL